MLQIGGLKSTFITAWMHGVIIYVVVCIFMVSPLPRALQQQR